MPYTMEDFRRDFTRDHTDLLIVDERLRGFPPEERLRGLSADDIEKLKKYLAELGSEEEEKNKR